MPRTGLKTLWPRLLLLFLTLMPGFTWQGWAQPGGMGQGGGMGGLMRGGGMGGPMEGGDGRGPGAGRSKPAPPRFDMSRATTITGRIESLGSYRPASWRSLPGMAVQGLILKTEQGNIEVYLGPPTYVSEQKFSLQTGDTLEVNGFKVLHGDKPAFFAAQVKKNNQTLTLLGEDGRPLWKQQETRGPGGERAGRGGRDPSQVEGGTTGPGSLGRGR